VNRNNKNFLEVWNFRWYFPKLIYKKDIKIYRAS